MQKEPLSLLELAQPKIVRAFRKKFTSAALEHRPVFDCGFIHRDIAPYRRINSPERNFKKPPNIRLAEWRSVSQKTTPIDEFQLIHDHRNISTAITCVEATLLLSIGWCIYILTCGLTLTYVRSVKRHAVVIQPPSLLREYLAVSHANWLVDYSGDPGLAQQIHLKNVD